MKRNAATVAFTLVVVLFGAGIAAFPESPERIETAIRSAQKDQANILVVLGADGKHRAFPASGLAQVDKNRITIRKGTFVVVEISVKGSQEKIAERFLDTWKHPNADVDAYLKSYKSPDAEIFFRYGKYDKEVTLEVSQVLLIAK